MNFDDNQYQVKIDDGSWSGWNNFYNDSSAAAAGTLGFHTGSDGTTGTWQIDRAELADISG